MKGTAVASSSAHSRRHEGHNGRHRSSKPRKQLPAAIADSSYAPGALRATTDRERDRIEALCLAHPEFGRLGHDPLLQLAETYLDDADHALRADLPMGAVGYRRRETDDVNPTWSDEAGFVSPQFVIFCMGVALLGLGLIAHPTTAAGEVADVLALVLGAAAIGYSFEAREPQL